MFDLLRKAFLLFGLSIYFLFADASKTEHAHSVTSRIVREGS